MQKFYRSNNRLIWGDNDREPKQQGRRRQRERQKTNKFRLAKQQLCTCITLFLYISLPWLQDYNVKCLISRFITRTWTQDNDFLFISWTLMKSFRIQFKEEIANMWCIEREVWGSASSLFKSLFRSRSRRCCLIVFPLILWRCVLHVLLLFGWKR